MKGQATIASEMVPVGGHHLHCITAGDRSSPPVVLLHSGLGSSWDWDAQVPALAAAGYCVLVYDRWGYGRSDERSGFAPPDFERDILDLQLLLDALAVEKPALIGHSDGATIALAYAARERHAVRGVVAVAAHAYVELKMVPGIRALQRRYESDASFRAALARRHGASIDSMARAWFAGWQRRESWLWDMREELTLVACPTLVVQGLDDEFTAPGHARDIVEAVPNAELELLQGVGHMVPQEKPDPFNAMAIEFLERAGSLRGQHDGDAV